MATPTDSRAPKKSFPREHYRRIYSVGNITDGIPTKNPSVMMAWIVIFVATLYELSTDIIRR
jgi:hypothetical protein